MDPSTFRSHFPEIGGGVYLNAASEGPMPAEAIEEGVRVAALKATPWEIGIQYYYEEPAAVRARIEAMIGAPAGTVALVPGTSAGIALAARGFRVAPGDEILLLEAQFPSNVNPWGAAAARGVSVRMVPRPFGSDPTDALLAALGPRTRIVSIDWVHFVDGAVCDLARIGEACRSRGIRFVVDAAQGAGAIRLDVGALSIDLLAAPSHKWLLGPVGTGFVYVSKEILDELQPWNAGWVNLAARSGFRNMLQTTRDPPDDATRFETGSPPYGLLVPWRISLELLASVGPEAIERRILTLAARAAEGLRSLAPAAGRSRGLELITPMSFRTASPLTSHSRSRSPSPGPGQPASRTGDAVSPGSIAGAIVTGDPACVGSAAAPTDRKPTSPTSWSSAPSSKSGIVSFRATDDRTISLYRALTAEGMTVAIREGAIRVSPHVYNTDAEIDALISACRRLLG